MPGTATTWLDTVVPSTVVSSAGNSAALGPSFGSSAMAVVVNVTAYTSGTITFEVQWSNDGINFWSADESSASGTQVKDTFANMSAVGSLTKVVQVKAPYYRIAWTTGSYTMNVQAGPVGPAAANTPDGFVLGAGSAAGASPVVGAIASTILTATFAEATASTYTAITAVPSVPSQEQPVPCARLSVKLNITANTWTSAVFEVLWSMTGAVYNASTNPLPLIHGDPADTFGALSAAATVIKELAVKAPFYAIAIISGTPGSATLTVDHCVTQY